MCLWPCQSKLSWAKQCWCVLCVKTNYSKNAKFHLSMSSWQNSQKACFPKYETKSFLSLPPPPFFLSHCLLFRALFWTLPCIYIHPSSPFYAVYLSLRLLFCSLQMLIGCLNVLQSLCVSVLVVLMHCQYLTSSLVWYPSHHLGS